MELAGAEIDVRPSQGQDFALAAAGQHQQADRRRGRQRNGAALDRLVQDLPQPGELGIGQEALAGTLGVFLDRPAGIEALRHQAPSRAQPVHVGEDLDALVGGDRPVGEPLVEFDDIAPLDRFERQPAEGRQDVVVEHDCGHAAGSSGLSRTSVCSSR